MSIASRIFLAATLAVGLTAPGGAHAALQGFSIDLGDPQHPLTLDWSATGSLSATAAPSDGQPAKELKNNGSYFTTLTGTYDVVDDLGSLDKTKPVLWQRSYEITLNGHVIFGAPDQIIGPTSGDDIWQAFVNVFAEVIGKNPMQAQAILGLLIGVLEHNDSLAVTIPNTDPPERFDYAYNTLNEPDGTFAFGTTESLGDKIALNAFPLANTLSFDFSAFVVPEPSTWAMLLVGFAGLGFVGYRRTRKAKPQAA
jgi:PEP-CTERM motif